MTYEVHPDDGMKQCRIEKDDPRFLLITNLITAQRYRRSILSLFPQTTKTHRLQDGDFKWELGCVASDAALQNGEVVTGNVIHISSFFGELEISFIGKTWRCTAENQEKWIAEMMDTMHTE